MAFDLCDTPQLDDTIFIPSWPPLFQILRRQRTLQLNSYTVCIIIMFFVQLSSRPSGIDNLPNEVSHILQEIKHRDSRTIGASPSFIFVVFVERVLELQQEIDKDASRYI